MKFTITFLSVVSLASTWGLKVKNEEPKDKREASIGYPGPSHGYQPQSLGHGDASSISIGAGYSIGGGAKPSYSFGGAEAGALQLSPENLQSSGHSTLQLPAIDLQSHQGLASNDLAQLMSQLTESLNSGGYQLGQLQAGGHGGQELSLPQYSFGGGDQQLQLSAPVASAPHYAAGTKGLGTYGSTGPVLFSPANAQGGQATYIIGGGGHSLGEGALALASGGHSLSGLSLGSGHEQSGGLSLGSSGHGQGAGLSLGSFGHELSGASFSQAPSGYSFGDSGHSLGGSGHSLGGAGHSFGASGLSLGGAGQGHGGHGLSLGSSGHSFGGSSSGHSFGGSGHSLGGPHKSLSSGYVSSGKTAFKPSTYLGSSVQSDSSHGLSSLSGYSSAPSFGSSYAGGHGLSLGSAGHGASLGSAGHGASLSSGGHGASFSSGGHGASLSSGGHGASLSSGGHGASLGSFGSGSTKYLAPAYSPGKSEGFGSSLDSVSAFSSGGHHSSVPGASFGLPSGHYHSSGGPSNSAHAASSHSPKYFVMTSKYPSSSGEATSYRGPTHHGLSSLSSGHTKYSYSHGPSSGSRYSQPSKDLHGAYSETSYNTIKYSEELKPRQ